MINCLAVDDEPLALSIIREFSSRIAYLNLAGTCSNAADAIELITRQKIDLILLDIHMPSISGLDLIKSLSNPPMVIFTTAHPQYALTGFDLDAIDYLVKPIPFDRFLKAMNKAYDRINLRESRISKSVSAEPKANVSDSIMIKADYATFKLKFNEILYVEGVKDYIRIVTTTRKYLTKSTLKNIEEKLPHEQFIRVHKSFIVSLANIDKIENNRIAIRDTHIAIGDQYKKIFNMVLEKKRL
jgi:two-component system, LytTR family, response regulator